MTTDSSRGRVAIGIDFGTESGRVLVLDLESGIEMGVHVVSYPHGVIDRALPGDDVALAPDWALQHPDDWVAVLTEGIPGALAAAGVAPEAVIGIGVDFTSCTVLPTDDEGNPLCRLERFRARPHAWPKLWKHHAAQDVADRLTEVALQRDEEFLGRYGGRISSEWYFPKLLEIWLHDREVYDAMDAFVEATDWIVWQLTGRLVRQACAAGYKAMWSPDTGLPSPAYFDAAYPGFSAPAEKLGSEFVGLGTCAGTLRPEIAATLGLPETVAVAVGNVDSFVSVPGLGVEGSGTYVMVVGTSICDMVIHASEIRVPGITGVLRDGILPGFYGYEAGQVAVGDMLAWFVETVGGAYDELEQGAAALAPGQTGLVALDWWNGNRSILADADLTGAIFGLNLQSSPQDIYRAMLESIGFGNRRIIDNFVEYGMPIEQIVACGGIAEKSPLMMQLIADVTGLAVDVPDSSEIPARGSALFGAVAAGAFPDVTAAARALRPRIARTYTPDPAAAGVYDRVYGVYRELYELLGHSRVELLHDLKQIRTRGGQG